MNDDMDFNLYVLAELNYKDAHPELGEELFHDDWYLSKDYKLKTEIIFEALKNNTLVYDTDKFKQAVLEHKIK